MFERLIGDAAPVSGNYLVGLRVGDVAGDFDPRKIGVDLPPYVAGRSVCVSVASQDGRYFAQNLYTIPSGASGPMDFDMPTKYFAALKSFPAGNMAITIRLAMSCNSANPGAFLPATLGSATASSGWDGKLTVFVNADPEDIELRLLHGTTPVGTAGECSVDTTNIHIAFTSRCILEAPGNLPAGGYTLEITKEERFSSEISRFALFRDAP